MLFGSIGLGTTQSTRLIKGLNRITTQTVPSTLKRICAHAARLAFVLVPVEIEARNASKVVPILAPKVSAAAMLKSMIP